MDRLPLLHCAVCRLSCTAFFRCHFQIRELVVRRNKKKNRLVALVCEKKLLGTILIIRSDLAIVCFINRQTA